MCTYIAGSAQCTSCDAVKFSDAVGASVASTCGDCGAGKYQQNAGVDSVCVRGREGKVVCVHVCVCVCVCVCVHPYAYLYIYVMCVCMCVC